MKKAIVSALLGIAILAAVSYAANEVKKYAVHDQTRPRPPVVTPADAPGQPPSDAIVLLNGKDLSQWRSGGGGEAKWKIEGDYMVVPPKGGDIQTVKEFGNCQLHIEWKTPEGVPPNITDQSRSNSGVFLMGRYEVQVLDSYTDDNYQTNKTYADGQAAAIYGQHPPIVNACRKPGQWQSYDIAFLRPLFDDQGNCIRKARVTVIHNGVVVHNNLEIEGDTARKQTAMYTDTGPIRLQDHGNPICFRNIWIRGLHEEPYLIQD